MLKNVKISVYKKKKKSFILLHWLYPTIAYSAVVEKLCSLFSFVVFDFCLKIIVLFFCAIVV